MWDMTKRIEKNELWIYLVRMDPILSHWFQIKKEKTFETKWGKEDVVVPHRFTIIIG